MFFMTQLNCLRIFQADILSNKEAILSGCTLKEPKTKLATQSQVTPNREDPQSTKLLSKKLSKCYSNAFKENCNNTGTICIYICGLWDMLLHTGLTELHMFFMTQLNCLRIFQAGILSNKEAILSGCTLKEPRSKLATQSQVTPNREAPQSTNFFLKSYRNAIPMLLKRIATTLGQFVCIYICGLWDMLLHTGLTELHMFFMTQLHCLRIFQADILSNKEAIS